MMNPPTRSDSGEWTGKRFSARGGRSGRPDYRSLVNREAPDRSDSPGLADERLEGSIEDPRSLAAMAVIDDEPLVLEVVAEMLRPRTIYSFQTGEQALAWFERHPLNRVAVVLCDYNLPGFSGVEAIWRLRSLDPNRRFILMSGCPVKDPERLVRMSLCDAFLSKPFEIFDLKRTIDRLLVKVARGGADPLPRNSDRVCAPANGERVRTGGKRETPDMDEEEVK